MFLNQNNKNIFKDRKEYSIVKDKAIYRIEVRYNNDYLTIISDNYLAKLNLSDLKNITKINLKDMSAAFNYITKIFDENKFRIKYIKRKKRMRLEYSINEKENETAVISLIFINSKNKLISCQYKIYDTNINPYFDENAENNYDYDNKNKSINTYINLLEIFTAINDKLCCLFLNPKNLIICYNLSHK